MVIHISNIYISYWLVFVLGHSGWFFSLINWVLLTLFLLIVWWHIIPCFTINFPQKRNITTFLYNLIRIFLPLTNTFILKHHQFLQIVLIFLLNPILPLLQFLQYILKSIQLFINFLSIFITFINILFIYFSNLYFLIVIDDLDIMLFNL
jgi:hypothetical protein